MRRHVTLICLVLMTVVTTAHGDILPEPDSGPPSASVGGLDFVVQSTDVTFPGGYQKRIPIAVLVGCVNGHPNCKLARSRKLIGMEVLSVDGQDLHPELGMLRQIVDAFERKEAAQTITLELFIRASDGKSIKVSFARQ